VAGRSIELESEQGADGVRSWNHLGTRKAIVFEHSFPRNFLQIRDKKKQAAKLRAKLAARQIQLLDVGDGGLFWARVIRPLLICAARQSSKALLLEDDRNISRTEWRFLFLKESLNVVDGKVLFAGLDNLLSEGIGLWGVLRPLGRR
jgi:hypothetical protein